ncbi:MAG: hypothetical protein D3916_13555 [Candidatus Electrothrix sp. MAN1_4]|nr:hypothetical protein [Candidatus Electrothrix sp. MAN1_4]
MIVISNSSPLIALSRINHLDIFKKMFGKIYIPDTVYQETVLQSSYSIQTTNIRKAVEKKIIVVEQPTTNHTFRRTIDAGERGVLNLAFDREADLLIIDDKKARNEAKELGFRTVKTSTLFRHAEKMGFIPSYAAVLSELAEARIYLPI